MRKSLFLRLNVLFAMFFIAFAVSLVFYNSYRNTQLLEDEMALTLETLISSINIPLSKSIRSKQLSQTHQIMSTICLNKNISRCILKSESQVIIDITPKYSVSNTILEFPIIYADQVVASMTFYIPKKQIINMMVTGLIPVIILLLITCVVSFFTFKIVLGHSLSEIQNFTVLVDHLDDDIGESHLMEFSPQTTELVPVVRSFKNYINRLSETQKELIEQEVIKEKSINNRQVAHDIRSPLEALKSVTSEIETLEYNAKALITNSIERITNIANDLLEKNKIKKSNNKSISNFKILLEDIIRDKQHELNLLLVCNIDVSYKNSHFFGEEYNLYRAISNIINNAYESYQGDERSIELDLYLDKDGYLILSVRDQGSGMPPSFVNEILRGGFTTKESGNGLGISFAKKVVLEHNGELTVNSKVGFGTEIKISIPSISAPEWYRIDQVQIKHSPTPQSNVNVHVLIDDDNLIHMSWQLEAKKNNIELHTYKTIDEFLEKSTEYQKTSKIYIDSNLENDIKGEVESEKIANLGFTELYLATGYAPEDIDKPEWIKEIVGKRAIF